MRSQGATVGAPGHRHGKGGPTPSFLYTVVVVAPKQKDAQNGNKPACQLLSVSAFAVVCSCDHSVNDTCGHVHLFVVIFPSL